MKILGVDSSATAASAAVFVDGRILSLQYANIGLTHSETLLPMIERALKVSGVSLSEIDCLAVSNGPGSFTGIRIGVASVKGLALPLQKPCIGISTLEVIARPLAFSGALAVAAMDARCKQVYTARFLCRGGFRRVSDDEAIPVADLIEPLKNADGPCVLIGDGAALVYRELHEVVPSLVLAPEMIRYQNAASVAVCANEKLKEAPDAAVTAGELLPLYLRVSQAERELKKKKSLIQK